MTSFKLAARVLVNLAALSTEGAVGNYNPLQRAYVVYRKSGGELDITEVPVITGNMIKHWHAMAIRDLEIEDASKKNRNPNLCSDCLRGVMMRTRLLQYSQHRYVKNCIVDDLHGLLHAETTIKRESLFNFANMLPIEEFNREGKIEISSLIHNRVVSEPPGQVSREHMMPFRKEYTSALFAFYAAADLRYVGVPSSDPYNSDGTLRAVIDQDERIRRTKLGLNALEQLLTQVRGAGCARALPHARLLEMVAVVGPNPHALMSSYYADYLELSLASIPDLEDGSKIFIYGITQDALMNKLRMHFGEKSEIVKCVSSWVETQRILISNEPAHLFGQLRSFIEESMRRDRIKLIEDKEIEELEKKLKEQFKKLVKKEAEEAG